ncbi:hypothetical protein GV828_01710 [Flavobacterium sp. NST-5]|uniref:Uncharacterized protein n=1 Tax=Flavobacterium ichthyis TaxID=2698827 RepID=A0ABW9Z4Z6_9FLAO|nr:hypothetical protein [Flavobacterium ichthyis]NBL63910.1 hypothetical protein [Flavobacterium ichthyis]
MNFYVHSPNAKSCSNKKKIMQRVVIVGFVIDVPKIEHEKTYHFDRLLSFWKYFEATLSEF